MIYSTLNALKAYESGLKTRLAQREECGDMPFSIYKLIECHRDFTSTKEELARIGVYERSKKLGKYDLRYGFLYCTPQDKHIWVKRMAAHNCFCLARNLVGVLHALPGDGVSDVVVNEVKDEVDRRIPDLLDLGDDAQIETKTGWKYVSKLIGTGNCLLDEFNDDCIELIEWVLDKLIAAKPRHPSGPFISFAEERQKSLEAYWKRVGLDV
ncbi:hypothetical protein N8559_05485 [Gammaproteobacteria bacterium]|nr:hypothetical protein [Gammaproteobacteria bacterium]